MSAFEKTYYFVDGSALIKDVQNLQKTNRSVKNKKLSINKFVEYFTGNNFRHLSGGNFKRFIIYFVKQDERIESLFLKPNPTSPGEVEDVCIKHCGKRIRGSKAAYRWIESKNPPKSVLDILNKSEKAVDTQLCCDALSLSCHNKIDRLFLYTNDYDFQPLCEALKSNGSNISLFRLFKKNVNKDLVENCDSFSVVKASEINTLFV